MRLKTLLSCVFLIAWLWAGIASATITNTFLSSGPYNSDGSTTVFAITFEYIADADITAQLMNNSGGALTTLVLNTDFTVQDGTTLSDGTFTGGQITIQPNAGSGIANGSGQIPSGYQLTISRAMTLNQLKSYPNNGAFPSASTEQALDKLTILDQQQQLLLSHSITAPSTDSGQNLTLPSSVARAGLFLGFDASGNLIAQSGTGGFSLINGTSPISAVTSGTTATISINSAVPVTLGGTGDTSLTSGALLVGAGTSAVTLLTPSNGSCAIGSGGAWVTGSCSGTSNMTLGSTTTTNPQISGSVTSGMYALSATATSAIGIQQAGVKSLETEWITGGVDYFTVTPGKSGTVPVLTVKGTTANQSINLTATGTGQVQLSGIAYPRTVTNNDVMASTASAVVNESVSTLLDNGLGSTVGAALVRTATAWTPLAGTVTGDTLTWNGTAWAQAAPSSGALVLIATVNASASASVVFTSSSITTTYKKYILEFDGVFTSDGQPINYTASINNGGGYTSPAGQGIPNGTVSGWNGFFSAMLVTGNGNTSAAGAVSGTLKFTIGSATVAQTYELNNSDVTSNGSVSSLMRAQGTLAGSVNNIKFVDQNGGTITGNFHLYGVSGT